MKIAIVGAGISGLVAAYRLQRDHDVTVFEAGKYAGGHTNTVDVELEGRSYVIDTGFMVYNDWTYPNFVRLLDELGVGSRATDMSFSVHDERSGVEYNGNSLNTLFAQRRNLVRLHFWRMLWDIVRFNRQARRLVADCDDKTTVGQFLERGRFSSQFSDNYLLPMGAAIWSCPPGKFAEFPIRFIVEFYHNHGLLNFWQRPIWRVIEGGARTYVRAMLRNFRGEIHLQTAVNRVERLADRVILWPHAGTAEAFDHVVFACHSDQALRILGEDATPVEREVLAAFPYQRNAAVLHTDASLLPKSRRAWASWNYRVHGGEALSATVTYNMNLLQGLDAPETFCVTLNDEERIAPERILRRFEYHHPVFNSQRAAAQARQGELLFANRSSFCGAYWGSGFHEAGVCSALEVVTAINKGSRVDPRRTGSSSFDRTNATEPLAIGAKDGG